MKTSKVWRNKQVAAMFDITPRLLIDLTEKGIVLADIDKGGRGSMRGYTQENLFDLALYQELNLLNLGYRHIRYLVEKVRNHPLKDTGLLVFRAKYDSPSLWWDIITEDEIRSKRDTVVSSADNISEHVGCSTVVVDLRSVRKVVKSKIV